MTLHSRREAPVDSDVDLHVAGQRLERGFDPAVLAVIAAGGVLGAEARYGIGLALPHGAAQLPWGTLLINVGGSLLLGMLMVVIVELTEPHRLVRPFLGVGVLGGFTTFSTASVEVARLIAEGHPATALAYLAGGAAAALIAVVAGATIIRGGAALLRRGKR